MPDTARSYATLQALLADNTSGDISAQDLRDFLATMKPPMGEISYFSVTGTQITIATQSDGSTNMVLVNLATSLNADSYEFDSPSNGRLRYTGTVTRMFHVAVSISFSGGANDIFVAGIAKGGTVVSESKILRKVGAGGDVGSTAIHTIVELAQNEYIELYVGNITNADDPTWHTLNLFAMGVMS